MKPRCRSAVSTYVEVFLLVGMASAGSAYVFLAAAGSTSSAQTPGVTVSAATIRQGTYFAFESLLVYNTGSAMVGSFVVTTTGVSPSAAYCYSLYDPIARSAVGGSCPTMASGPGTVSIIQSMAAGRGLLVEFRIAGSAFTVGSVSRLGVTTSAGAEQSLDVSVLPA